MDELYRKAGELYPLNTDGADWDKVMTRLQEISDEEGASAVVGGGRSSRKWWWLMLLIVPFAWMGIRYITHQGATNKSTPQNGAVVSAPLAGSAEPGHPGTSTPGTSIPGTSTPGTSTPGASRPGAGQANASQSSAGQTPADQTPAGQALTTQRAASAASRGTTGAAAAKASAARGAASSLTLRETLASGGNNSTLENPTTPGGALETPPADLAYAFGGADFGLPGKPKGDARVDKTADTGFRVSDAVKHGPLRGHPNGFYAGLEAGPDMSTIKWQELQHPGYSVGVLLGYRFNRRLAVEVSGLWAHKVYYTSGQYFSKAKTDIPPGVKVGDMNGTCGMFEIPINLRWDFLYTKSGSFYATAGLSSYIMKRENYSYVASYSGTPPWTGMEDKSYYNSGNNFLSMMGLSLGYQLHWKGVGDLRIEPYFKVPLTGVGIGSLPITSSGLYLGLTRSFR
jgi:hypothetical protein